MPLYIGDLSIYGFGHLPEILEPILCRFRGTTVVGMFWGVKSYKWIFNCIESLPLAPCIVQRSTVFNNMASNMFKAEIN